MLVITFEYSEITVAHSDELEMFLKFITNSEEDHRVFYSYFGYHWPTNYGLFEKFIGFKYVEIENL